MPENDVLERLRAHVEAYVTRNIENLDRFSGNGDDQLSEYEEVVFHLRLIDMPRLAEVFWIWRVGCGIIDACIADDPELTEQAQAELGLLKEGRTRLMANGEAGSDFINLWIEFAKLFDISSRISHAFYWKTHFSYMRRGYIEYPDAYNGVDYVQNTIKDSMKYWRPPDPSDPASDDEPPF